ncbi:hypothetical protein EVAR_76902_1 [Eumeta japonica]|uniref:Uncharacterized protein n=1 Tax=Eumeta variegata TaxID=151549 RepID=A0A4C1SEW2_EUMVA|nr:hypothetical protein EVAR_76902_1 [Eumeta japonica]
MRFHQTLCYLFDSLKMCPTTNTRMLDRGAGPAIERPADAAAAAETARTMPEESGESKSVNKAASRANREHTCSGRRKRIVIEQRGVDLSTTCRCPPA